MTDRIMTRHPEGKAGVNIERDKYELIRQAILDVLAEGPATFTGLSESVENRINGHFEGNIPWYVVTVKLDLEARGNVKRIKESGRLMFKLTKK